MITIVNYSTMVFLIILSTIFGYLYWLNKTKKIMPRFRILPGILALEELVGRAVEMGRPLLYLTGYGSLRSDQGPEQLGSFAIFGETARICAKSGAEIIAGILNQEHIPIITSLAEEAYRRENAMDSLNYNNLIYLGASQYSSNAYLMVTVEQREVVSFIATGWYGADMVVKGGVARSAGCLSLGATANPDQYPYLVAAFDYWLIGEDLLSAGAQISKDPGQITNVWAGDYIRFLLISIIIIGSILAWVGFNIQWIFNL